MACPTTTRWGIIGFQMARRPTTVTSSSSRRSASDDTAGTLLTMTPGEVEVRVGLLPDAVDGVGHGADAAQAERGRLDHDDREIGGGQPGRREVAERGRAVDEDGVVAVGQAEERLAQLGQVATGGVLPPAQPGAGRQEVDPVAPAARLDRPHRRAGAPAGQDVGHGGVGRGRVVTQHPAAAGLRIEVDDQHTAAVGHGRGGQPERHRRLPHAALLVDHGHDRTHAGHAATLGRDR